MSTRERVESSRIRFTASKNKNGGSSPGSSRIMLLGWQYVASVPITTTSIIAAVCLINVPHTCLRHPRYCLIPLPMPQKIGQEPHADAGATFWDIVRRLFHEIGRAHV